MMDPDIRRNVEESFARQTLMATFGAEVTRIAPGEVEITAPIRECARQQQGLAHAGLTFSLGDSAAGYSALSLLPATAEVVTSEMKINLLAPGRGAALVARGRVIRPGRRLIVSGAEVFARAGDGTETLIAVMTGTLVPVAQTAG